MSKEVVFIFNHHRRLYSHQHHDRNHHNNYFDHHSDDELSIIWMSSGLRDDPYDILHKGFHELIIIDRQQ